MPALFTTVAVVDVETTGLPPDAAIVEVGRTDLRLYPEGWRIEGATRSALVAPGRPIPPEASAIHHILDVDVVGAMSPAEALVFATAGADTVASHNWQFDGQFLRTALPALCTLKGARQFWPDLKSHANQAVRYARGLCVSPEDRLRGEPTHRAGPDTFITATILLDLLKEASLERLVEITAGPTRLLRMPMGKHRGKRWSEIDEDYLDWILRSDLGSDIKESARHEIRRRRKAA